MHFDARLVKPPAIDVGITVGGDDLHAPPRERERGGLAGTREADDEHAARQLDGRSDQRRKKVKSR